MICPDMKEVLLEGRTHRDFSSALYGLLSETARALDRQLQSAVKSHRTVEATPDVLPPDLGLVALGDSNRVRKRSVDTGHGAQF